MCFSFHLNMFICGLAGSNNKQHLISSVWHWVVFFMAQVCNAIGKLTWNYWIIFTPE